MSTDTNGKFGDYGGQYVPEALMPAIEELTDAYERYVLENEDGFMDEFRSRLRDFGGRPTPLQRADRLSDRYDTEVYLKREDLLHGGAHKLNNALGQVLLAKYMGKERIIAVAVPCWPAPVSAMIRSLPMYFAKSTCPRALLSLCAPPWRRSSRLRYTSVS